MTSERECYVFVVLPGGTEFVTAGRFRVSRTRDGSSRGEFVYGRGYLDRPDAWSWDAPFSHTAGRYAESRDPSIIWEGHKAGRDIGYCHLEKLHNLEALPGDGFTVCCFPVKIRGASAGWTRAVAILDD